MTPARLYDILLATYGPQDWWPGDTPFEVAVGAVLAQNTAWVNVQMAILALKAGDAMTTDGILALSPAELEQAIRSAGFYRVKAGYLRTLAAWIKQRADGDLSSLADEEITLLRNELLALRGIGPETADSILLYAIGKPVFVVDAYTRRIGARLAILPESPTYEQVQQAFTRQVPRDASLFNEFHALLVRLAKEHCRVQPLCLACPLAPNCPSSTDTAARRSASSRRHVT